MSGKWTPGPWEIVVGTNLIWGDCKSVEFDGFERFGKPVATAEQERHWARQFEKMSEGEVEANACLIAAAPELAEALEFYANPEVYEAHPHGLSFERRDLSYVARAALAKAKGEGA